MKSKFIYTLVLKFLVVSGLMAIPSCIRDTIDPRKLSTDILLNPVIAVPVGYSRLTTGNWNVTLPIIQDTINHIDLSDTLSFYFPSALPSADKIERIIMHLNFVNSFPFTIKPQIYLLNESGETLDSLFVSPVYLEGSSGTGLTSQPVPRTHVPIDIELTGTKFNELTTTHFIVVKGRITRASLPDQNITTYSNDYFDTWLGLILKLKINPGAR